MYPARCNRLPCNVRMEINPQFDGGSTLQYDRLETISICLKETFFYTVLLSIVIIDFEFFMRFKCHNYCDHFVMNQQTRTSRSDDDLNVNKDSSRSNKIVASVNKVFQNRDEMICFIKRQ